MTKGWKKTAEEAEVTLWLPGEVPMYFRKIPAGRFRMGSRGYDVIEEPVTEVVISEPFYMAAFPVTQHQWRAVVEAMPIDYRERNGLLHVPSHFKHNKVLPVEYVSWNDAQYWLKFLSRQKDSYRLDFKTDAIELACCFRLPCEAEWEYACRVGIETDYYTGDGDGALADAGWYAANSNHSTQLVGRRDANKLGLHDMHGNIWEWCTDLVGFDAYCRRAGKWKARAWGVEDEGEASMEDDHGNNRVLKGGAWNSSSFDCRSASRDFAWAGDRNHYQGFRVGLFLV